MINKNEPFQVLWYKGFPFSKFDTWDWLKKVYSSSNIFLVSDWMKFLMGKWNHHLDPLKEFFNSFDQNSANMK